MPGEVIDRPNPQPLPSQIDESVASLAVKLKDTNLNDEDRSSLREFRRVASYLAAGIVRPSNQIPINNSE